MWGGIQVKEIITYNVENTFCFLEPPKSWECRCRRVSCHYSSSQKKNRLLKLLFLERNRTVGKKYTIKGKPWLVRRSFYNGKASPSAFSFKPLHEEIISIIKNLSRGYSLRGRLERGGGGGGAMGLERQQKNKYSSFSNELALSYPTKRIGAR